MIGIILSVIFTSLIFIIFKLITKFNIDSLQAIVTNYFCAFFCGYFTYYSNFTQKLYFSEWWVYSLILSALFISIFTVMEKSSNTNGIGLTSISTKMSLILSISFFFFYYKEIISSYKIIGIGLALISVILISLPGKKTKLENTSLLIIIFFGSGIIEIIIGFTNNLITSQLQSVFSAFSFLFAAFIGLCYLIIKITIKKTKISIKSILAGIILGVPNYFSIYFIFYALNNSSLSKSSVIAIINISIVLITFLIGLLFKEKMKTQHYFGIVLSIIAIILLSM